MIVSLTYEENGNRHCWYLRRGEKAVLGNSPWCDFVLPDWENTPAVSCTLHFQEQLLVAADAESDLKFNNTPMLSKTLDFDDRFQLMQYSLQVGFIGHSAKKNSHYESSLGDAEQSTRGPRSPHQKPTLWFVYDSVPQLVLMSDSGKKLYLAANDPKQAIDHLVRNELLEDAVRALAGMLPLKKLLSWCYDCLKGSDCWISENHRQALTTWLLDPLSVSQPEMANIVPWNDNRNPWTHLLAAISWIQPNNSSPQTWCPPATMQMVIASVIAAVQLATATELASPFRKLCIERGMDLLQKELRDTASGVIC